MIENNYAIGYGIVIDFEEKSKLYNKFLEQGMSEEELEWFSEEYCPILSSWINRGYFLGIIFYINEDTKVKPISKLLNAGTRFAFDSIFNRYNLLDFLRDDLKWEPTQQFIHFTR